MVLLVVAFAEGARVPPALARGVVDPQVHRPHDPRHARPVLWLAAFASYLSRHRYHDHIHRHDHHKHKYQRIIVITLS